jgi:hypothetical protein
MSMAYEILLINYSKKGKKIKNKIKLGSMELCKRRSVINWSSKQGQLILD